MGALMHLLYTTARHSAMATVLTRSSHTSHNIDDGVGGSEAGSSPGSIAWLWFWFGETRGLASPPIGLPGESTTPSTQNMRCPTRSSLNQPTGPGSQQVD